MYAATEPSGSGLTMPSYFGASATAASTRASAPLSPLPPTANAATATPANIPGEPSQKC